MWQTERDVAKSANNLCSHPTPGLFRLIISLSLLKSQAPPPFSLVQDNK